MLRLLFVLALAQLSMFAPPLAAQLTLEQIESSAPAESDRIQQLMTALENPDPNYRMHAFKMIVEKGGDYERRLALQRAFLGTDVNLRNAALKRRLAEMPVLRVEILNPKSKDKLTNSFFKSRDSAWVELKVALKDERTGLFDVNGKEAYVIDDQFAVSFFPSNLLGTCNAEFSIKDDLSLSGPLKCGKVAKLQSRAPLF